MIDRVMTYGAKVEEVHSGDDYLLLVNLQVDGLYKLVRVRLFGVDTPNAYRASADTEAGKLRDEIRKILNGKCIIDLVTEGKGGWIVKMYTHEPDGARVCLNDMLRERGYVFTPSYKGTQQ